MVRHRTNLRFHTVEERDLPEKRHQNILKDEIVELDVAATYNKYPRQIRRVVAYDDEHGTTVELLTNNFTLAASTIAALYKARWNIEIFFRNLKQLFSYKVVCRHYTQCTQCRGDSDLDSPNHHSATLMAAPDRKIPLASI